MKIENGNGKGRIRILGGRGAPAWGGNGEIFPGPIAGSPGGPGPGNMGKSIWGIAGKLHACPPPPAASRQKPTAQRLGIGRVEKIVEN